MTLSSILITLGLIVVFIGLFAFILKEGGWQKGGCNGDCSSCHSACDKAETEKTDKE